MASKEIKEEKKNEKESNYYIANDGARVSIEECSKYKGKFLSFTPHSWAVQGAMSILGRIDRYRPVYVEVGKRCNMPSLVIGTIHYLEADNDFRSSIRDGSALGTKDWVEDAGKVLYPFGFKGEWDIGFALWTLERYNGFGYRRRGIESPYLWSGTNLYKKGKFVKDGVFDPEVKSKQVGGAVVFRMAYLKLLSQDCPNPFKEMFRV